MSIFISHYQRVGQVPAVEGLVGAVQLCVGLFEQRSPKLIALGRVRKEELAHGAARKEVVDAHLDPIAKPPEPEPVHPRILVVGAILLLLVVRNHLFNVKAA